MKKLLFYFIAGLSFILGTSRLAFTDSSAKTQFQKHVESFKERLSKVDQTLRREATLAKEGATEGAEKLKAKSEDLSKQLREFENKSQSKWAEFDQRFRRALEELEASVQTLTK